MEVVSFWSLFQTFTFTLSPMFTCIEGHGHCPLIPTAGRWIPSGDTETQSTSQLYVTVFLAFTNAWKVNDSKNKRNCIVEKIRNCFRTRSREREDQVFLWQNLNFCMIRAYEILPGTFHPNMGMETSGLYLLTLQWDDIRPRSISTPRLRDLVSFEPHLTQVMCLFDQQLRNDIGIPRRP